MGKTVSKSIRMTGDLYAYIENYRGNGFNEKFENIILDARDAEPQRRERLEFLDKQIARERQALQEVRDQLAVFRRMSDNAVKLDIELGTLLQGLCYMTSH